VQTRRRHSSGPNRGRTLHLRALPVRPLPYTGRAMRRCRRASAVRVLKHSYSVSSLLIGHRCASVTRRHCGTRSPWPTCRGYGCRIGSDKTGSITAHYPRPGAQPGAFPPATCPRSLVPELGFRRAYDVLLVDGSDSGPGFLRADFALGGKRRRGMRASGARIVVGRPIAPTYESGSGEVRGERTPEGCLSGHYGRRIWRSRPTVSANTAAGAH